MIRHFAAMTHLAAGIYALYSPEGLQLAAADFAKLIERNRGAAPVIPEFTPLWASPDSPICVWFGLTEGCLDYRQAQSYMTDRYRDLGKIPLIHFEAVRPNENSPKGVYVLHTEEGIRLAAQDFIAEMDSILGRVTPNALIEEYPLLPYDTQFPRTVAFAVAKSGIGHIDLTPILKPSWSNTLSLQG